MQRDGKLYCNCCGREIRIDIGGDMEEYFHIKKNWGYFSQKDGITQSADICESCLDQWMQTFRIPPEERERTEIFEC